ncbi:hypothetical protein HYV70_01810 [Candidatus Uhrbacteria bacterium]|nr:hypothetical protein [Candidatus Uhrbacteria bacterium]
MSPLSREFVAPGLYEISDLVRDALEQEGLKTEEGEINVAHFLMYLAHDPSVASRFRGKDEVLVSLGRPSMFGAYDLTSVRAEVRKGWKPTFGNETPPPVQKKASSGAPLSLTREQIKILRKILGELIYDPSAIRMVVEDAGLIVWRIEISGVPEIIWENIIKEADKEVRLRALIETLSERYPANQTLKSFLN